MSLQLKNIDQKIKKLKKDSVIDVGNYINKILPENFQNYTIKKTMLGGSIRQLRIRLKELLYVLKRVNPGIFQQVLEHINTVSVALKPTIQHELTTKKINGSLNEAYVRRLYELFEQISKNIFEKNYEECLKEGHQYFLKWNKLKANLITQSLVRMFSFEKSNEMDEVEEYIENLNEIRTKIENFFQELEKKEIKILLLGYFFWGQLNQELKKFNETIYILVESLPKINLRIFDILSNLLQNMDNTLKDITKLEVSDIYNDIYDKTEGFEIKIEPWLIY